MAPSRIEGARDARPGRPRGGLLTVLAPERPLPAGTTGRALERLFPTPNPYLRDPDGWARERLGIESWSKPREIRQSVLDNRHTAVPACHDSAKTHTAASIACWWLDTHRIGEAFVVSTAPTQHQVETLLWGEIRDMHDRASLSGDITPKAARWTVSDTLVAFGRKSADEADPKKAMQSFQGKHARYMLVIIDEAGGVPEWLFHSADALATNANARVLAIGNPDDPRSYFAEICKPGSKWNVIAISAFDTPRWTNEPVSDVLRDEHLISDVYVDEMRLLGEDSHLFQSKVLGRFPDVSEDAVFPPRILEKTLPSERRRLGLPILPGVERGGYGVDVARYGDAETAIYRNRGGVIELIAATRRQDTEEVAALVERTVAHHGARSPIPIVVDAVGVGAGVYDKLRHRGHPAIDFNGGESAHRPERYLNRRAEAFWELRVAMDEGRVQLDPKDSDLLRQLGRIKWKPIHGGRVQIESKEDARRRGEKSPDRADAVAMAFAAPALPDGPVGVRVKRDELYKDAEQLDAGALSLTADLLDRPL